MSFSFRKPLGIPGTLVEVYGKGVLLLGIEGARKSSLAYELIQRGHVFVADDLVMIQEKKQRLWGSSVRDQYFLDLKEQGMIDIRQKFGETRIKNTTIIDFAYILGKISKEIFFYEELLQKKIFYYALNNEIFNNALLLIETKALQETKKCG
jgi:HPr kinase/phosphorylase